MEGGGFRAVDADVAAGRRRGRPKGRKLETVPGLVAALNAGAAERRTSPLLITEIPQL